MLLCNRFRRNALATSMSRQMSDGLSCYLVEPRKHLNPESIVACLGPTDRSSVVTRREAEAYVKEWKAWFERPALVRWLGRFGR